MSDSAQAATKIAREAGDHPAVRAMARVGYAASGVIHFLIGWIALRVALREAGTLPSSGSAGSSTADQSGALQSIASTSWGQPLLWVLAAGLAGLALWQLAETLGGWHGTGREAVFSRIKAASKAIVYLALAGTTTTYARGGSASSSKQSVEVTAQLMDQPYGRLLVAAVGVVVVGVGLYHVAKGAGRRFLKDLVGNPGRAATYAGMAGYIAKGVALVVVGGLFVAAAWHGNAGEARGLDGALRTLARTPYGAVLLGAVALGIGAYGFYSFVRARYTKV